LGYEVTTDVFDLQLAGPQSFSVALPLAAALRDALARKLGVEVAEMGIAASQTLADDGVPWWSILIYDKAPGGAIFGFSRRSHRRPYQGCREHPRLSKRPELHKGLSGMRHVPGHGRT
jgi:DEAD/DEAH box helicase domain-containing protein